MADKQDAVSTADSGAASKDASNNGAGGPKAIIKSVDMSEDLQQESVNIATSALALFLERGFDHVSINEIAGAAGVSKMTVFNYFPAKEDNKCQRKQ